MASYPTSIPTFPSAATLAAQGLDSSPHSTLHGNLGAELQAGLFWLGTAASPSAGTVEYRLQHKMSSYSPTPNGNGLTTITSTWSGKYARLGDLGKIRLKGIVTANWAGSGFLSIPLPSGWTAANDGFECANITGYVAQKPSIGAHDPIIGVVHPNDTEIRLITPDRDATSNVNIWYALDGVNYPIALTGDGGGANDDEIHINGEVWLEPV